MNIMKFKKYKLLQDFGVLKKGDIISRRWEMSGFNVVYSDYYCRIINNSYDYGFELHEKLILNSPDWFAPMLFTTEDGVDVYKGDIIWVLNRNNLICSWFSNENTIDVFCNDKIFSTKQAAEKYLLLEEAKRKYPIGTNVLCLSGLSSVPLKITSYKHIQQDELEIWFMADILGVKVFSDGKWAEKYLEPKFKVGDCFVYDNEVHKIDNIKISSFISNEKSYDKALCKKATNDEIIKYYEKLGWIKGAKFKAPKPYPFIGIFNNIVFGNNFIGLWLTDDSEKELGCDDYKLWNIEECELINYPKSWEDLKEIDGFYIANDINDVPAVKKINYSKPPKDEFIDVFKTEKQAESALAFAQLSQLVAEINGDWQPDWENILEAKYGIGRHLGGMLVREIYRTSFNPLVFKTQEMVDFSFEHHKQLWQSYYEIE